MSPKSANHTSLGHYPVSGHPHNLPGGSYQTVIRGCDLEGEKISPLFLSPFHSDKEVVEFQILEFQCEMQYSGEKRKEVTVMACRQPKK